MIWRSPGHTQYIAKPAPAASAATVSRCAPLPSQKLLFTLLGEWCLPSGGCRTWTKLLPGAAGGGQNFCRRLGSSMALTCARWGVHLQDWTGGGGGHPVPPSSARLPAPEGQRPALDFLGHCDMGHFGLLLQLLVPLGVDLEIRFDVCGTAHTRGTRSAHRRRGRAQGRKQETPGLWGNQQRLTDPQPLGPYGRLVLGAHVGGAQVQPPTATPPKHFGPVKGLRREGGGPGYPNIHPSKRSPRRTDHFEHRSGGVYEKKTCLGLAARTGPLRSEQLRLGGWMGEGRGRKIVSCFALHICIPSEILSILGVHPRGETEIVPPTICLRKISSGDQTWAGLSKHFGQFEGWGG